MWEKINILRYRLGQLTDLIASIKHRITTAFILALWGTINFQLGLVAAGSMHKVWGCPEAQAQLCSSSMTEEVATLIQIHGLGSEEAPASVDKYL